MLRQDDPIREAAERLRRSVGKDRGRQGIQPATITSIRGKNDRDLVECELDTGEIVNAIAHGQGDLVVGQTVYLERLHGERGRHWLVIQSAATPEGYRDNPPPKAITIYKGKHPRLPKRIPSQYVWMPLQPQYTGTIPIDRDTVVTDPDTGETVSHELMWFPNRACIMRETQHTMQVQASPFTFLKATVQLTKRMDTNKVEWWLFAFADSDGDGEFADEFAGAPNWGFPIRDPKPDENGDGENERVLVGYGDLTSEEAAPLLKLDYFTFVLALVKIREGIVKRKDIGAVRRATIRLLDDAQYEDETGSDPWPYEEGGEQPL